MLNLQYSCQGMPVREAITNKYYKLGDHRQLAIKKQLLLVCEFFLPSAFVKILVFNFFLFQAVGKICSQNYTRIIPKLINF